MIISAIGTVPVARLAATAALFPDTSSMHSLTISTASSTARRLVSGSVAGGVCGGASFGCWELFAGGVVDTFQPVQPVRVIRMILDTVENHVDALIAVPHRAGQDAPRRQRQLRKPTTFLVRTRTPGLERSRPASVDVILMKPSSTTIRPVALSAGSRIGHRARSRGTPMVGCGLFVRALVFQYFSGVYHMGVGAIGQVGADTARAPGSSRRRDPLFASIWQKKVERHLAQFTGSMTSFKSLSETVGAGEFGGDHEARLVAHDHHLGLTQRHARHFAVDQPLLAGSSR